MRRLWALAIVFVVGAACGSDGSSAPKGNAVATTAATVAAADLAPSAVRVTELLVANDWPRLREQFNPSMLAGQSEDGLKTGWATIVEMYGKYSSHGDPTRIGMINGESVWETPITFGTHRMKIRVTFDASGQVAGLNILEA